MQHIGELSLKLFISSNRLTGATSFLQSSKQSMFDNTGFEHFENIILYTNNEVVTLPFARPAIVSTARSNF